MQGKWLLEEPIYKATQMQSYQVSYTSQKRSGIQVCSLNSLLSLSIFTHFLLPSSLTGRPAASMMSFSISYPPSFASYLNPSLWICSFHSAYKYAKSAKLKTTNQPTLHYYLLVV